MQACCVIKNARVVSPGIDSMVAAVEVENGRITRVLPNGAAIPPSERVYEAEGMILAPGFIDIHTHGKGGHDFCDATEDSLQHIAKAKLAEGVTSFLPTTLTLSSERLRKTFESAQHYFQDPTDAKVPGIHLEGPFINPECVGAQNPEFVRDPDVAEIEALHRLLPIRIVSLAIEMPGAVSAVKRLRERGIIPSLAHSAATYAQFLEGVAAGAQHLTHFCNQMTPLHHREIGLVGGGLLHDSIRLELICDGTHLSPEMIQLAFKVAGPGRIMLITDSNAAAGLGDNVRLNLGGLEVVVRDGVARLPSGALAGSTLTMNEALRRTHHATSLPLEQLIASTSWIQANAIGLSHLGKIQPGFIADLVLLDDGFQPQAVFVDGTERLGRIHPS